LNKNSKIFVVRHRIRGAVIALEFLLALGLVAVLFATILALAQILNLKQQTIHNARFAGLQHSITELPTANSKLQQAIGNQTAKWELNHQAGAVEPAGLLSSVPRELSGFVAKAVGGSGETEAIYQINGRIEQPLIFGFSSLTGKHRYSMPVGFWSNQQCGHLSGLLQSVNGNFF
jgi:hypothetical protein